MNPLTEMIHGGATTADIAAYLDSLSGASRRRLIESLRRRDMAALFDRVEGAPLGLDHFVPASARPLDEVIHYGKNSLPAFTTFQKRFCKPPAAHQGVLWGYNHNPEIVQRPLGPGYFVARPGEVADTPVWIDYHLIPPDKPAAWPTIHPNSYRLSRVVYHKTIDRMRKVSEHVSIGSAFKKDKPIGAWFMLCRDERA